MIDALANYGYLPHNGLNISMADLIIAFNLSVNLAAEATELIVEQALLTSTTGDLATFTLDDLDEYGSKPPIFAFHLFPHTEAVSSPQTQWKTED
jgi:hypothetical protein